MRCLAIGLFVAFAVCDGRLAEACPPDPQGIAASCLGLPETAKAEGRAPIPERGQAVEREAERSTEDNQQPRPELGWPPNIEAAEKASSAECGTKEECRSEQRGYSELRAQ